MPIFIELNRELRKKTKVKQADRHGKESDKLQPDKATECYNTTVAFSFQLNV